MFKTLYIHRPVLNAEAIIKHYKDQGFTKTVSPEDMHVTQMYSKTPVDWDSIKPVTNQVHVHDYDHRSVARLGDKGAVVTHLKSEALSKRFDNLMSKGCGYDYESYQPHSTITYDGQDLDLSKMKPYGGVFILGPEKFSEVNTDWTAVEKSMTDFVIEMPLIVKAHTTADGRRIIKFESSNQAVDQEGDCILQKALLDSKDSFLRGHVDLDHLSEKGAEYGLYNPEQYIVGRPLSVFDMGGYRTGVEAELFKGNPHADKIWEGLTKNPPEAWSASIYGFPVAGGLVDVSKGYSGETYGATRYLVSKIHWKSVALTQHPVNNKITGMAQIVKSEVFMKSRMPEILKSYGFVTSGMGLSETLPASNKLYGPTELPQDQKVGGNTADTYPQSAGYQQKAIEMPSLHAPRNRVELLGHHTHHIALGKCPCVDFAKNGNSVYGLRQHFMKCCAMDEHQADVNALATMYLLKHRQGA